MDIPQPRGGRSITASENTEDEEGVGEDEDDTMAGASDTGGEGIIPADWKLQALKDIAHEDEESNSQSDPESNLTTKKKKNGKVVKFADQTIDLTQGSLNMDDDDSEDDEDFDPDKMEVDTDESTDEDSSEDELSSSDTSSVSSDSVDSPDSSSESGSSSSSGSSSDTSDSDSESDSDSSDSAASDKPDVRSSRIQQESAPKFGRSATQSRNHRRRDAGRIRRLIAQGVLPENATTADYHKWLQESKISDEPTQAKIDTAAERYLARLKKKQRASGSGRGAFHMANGKKTTFSDANDASTAGEIKRRQAALLAELQETGAIDVTPTVQDKSNKRKVDELAITAFVTGQSVEKPTTAAATTDTPRKRARLDLASSQRMLFGSLGVRAPKNKEDADKLREKLDASKQPKKRPPPPETTAEPSIPESTSPNFWKKHINLSAFECWNEEVELPPPPFPFTKNWVKEAKNKTTNKKQQKKKAKRQNQKQKQKRNRSCGSEGSDGSDHVFLNYDDEEEEVEEEGEEEPTAMDVDEAIQSQLQRDESTAQLEMPPLPEDINSLPVLTNENAQPGAIIVFKHLECSEQTNWNPTVSGFKTALIEELTEAETLKLKLADRDVPRAKKVYDKQGNRVYQGFDAIEVDDSDDEDEEMGVLYEEFGQLVEAKLLRAAPVANGLEDGGNEGVDEVNGVEMEITETAAAADEEVRAGTAPEDGEVREFQRGVLLVTGLPDGY